jgi:hypothetical protein
LQTKWLSSFKVCQQYFKECQNKFPQHKQNSVQICFKICTFSLFSTERNIVKKKRKKKNEKKTLLKIIENNNSRSYFTLLWQVSSVIDAEGRNKSAMNVFDILSYSGTYLWNHVHCKHLNIATLVNYAIKEITEC